MERGCLMLVNWEDDGIPGGQSRSGLGFGAGRIYARCDVEWPRASDHAGAKVVHVAVAVRYVKRELKNHSLARKAGGVRGGQRPYAGQKVACPLKPATTCPILPKDRPLGKPLLKKSLACQFKFCPLCPASSVCDTPAVSIGCGTRPMYHTR